MGLLAFFRRRDTKDNTKASSSSGNKGIIKKTEPVVVDDRLRHIAFIMDGNGRWAQKRGMPREYGHVEGAATFKRIVRYCGDIGIKIVTIYAFSTENWRRPKSEVDRIMSLLNEYLDGAERELEENKIRYVFLGDKMAFPQDVRERMRALERASAKYDLRLNIAINYGARAEIVRAAQELAATGGEISERTFAEHLYTCGCPDPDLIVRTGGEMRLSNFLLYQAAYSELYFTDVLWPDMQPSDVDAAVREFYRRSRRFGGVEAEKTAPGAMTR